MKIRTGFVSNSSSSSFIIGLEKIPKTVDEVHQLLFHTTEYFPIHFYDNKTDSRIVAMQVFEDLQSAIILNSDDKVLEEIQNGYWETYPDFDYNSNTESDIIRRECFKKFDEHPAFFHNSTDQDKKDIYQKWKIISDKEDAERNKLLEESAKKYWQDNKSRFDNLQKILLEYSDNDGELSTILEHGDIFRLLPYICISKH